jgi:uncharacterized membrane protein SpoIIM required for sporulation
MALLGAATIGMSLSVHPVRAGRRTLSDTDKEVSQVRHSCAMVMVAVSGVCHISHVPFTALRTSTVVPPLIAVVLWIEWKCGLRP